MLSVIFCNLEICQKEKELNFNVTSYNVINIETFVSIGGERKDQNEAHSGNLCGFWVDITKINLHVFHELDLRVLSGNKKNVDFNIFKLSKSHIIALTLFVVMPDVGQLKALERGRRRQTFVFL